MMMRKGRAAGVDLGHSSVKIVEVEGNRLTRWAAVDLPRGAIQNGIVRDVPAVAECVRRAAATAGLGGATVHAAVSGAACVVRRLRLPALDARDLALAVRWEAERLLPYPRDEAVVDFQVLGRSAGEGPGQIDVLVAGVRTEVLHGYVAAIEGAGLRLGTVGARPLARLRACRSHVQAPGVLLVGLGAHATEFTTMDDRGLLYTRTVPVGTGAPDREGVVEASGSPGYDERDGLASPVDEIIRSIRFFESQSGAGITAVALTGGGAEDPALPAALRARTGLPVVVVDPLAALESQLSPPPGPRLAAAVGLARRGQSSAAADGDAAVDFMRPALRRPRPRVPAIIAAAAAALVATIAVVALLASIIIQSARVARVAAGIDREIAALQPQWTAVRDQAVEIRRVRRELEALERILATPEWVSLFESLQAATPPGLWWTRVAAGDGGTVEITARTANAGTIAEFLRRLKAAPGVRNARLVTTEAVRDGDRDILQAHIAAQVAAR